MFLKCVNRRASSMVSFTLLTTGWRRSWVKRLMRVEASSRFRWIRKWSWLASNSEVTLLSILP